MNQSSLGHSLLVNELIRQSIPIPNHTHQLREQTFLLTTRTQPSAINFAHNFPDLIDFYLPSISLMLVVLQARKKGKVNLFADLFLLFYHFRNTFRVRRLQCEGSEFFVRYRIFYVCQFD